MPLPPEVEALVEQFNHNFRLYTEQHLKLIREQVSRRELFSERFVQAIRQLDAGNENAGNDVASYELLDSSAFNEEWLNRYSLCHNQMIDKLNSIFSQLYAASDDPIYAQAFWRTLGLDKIVSKERNLLSSIQEFQKALQELKFSEVQHKQSQVTAINSIESVIKEIEYGVACLMRMKIALWKGQDPTSEDSLTYSGQE